MYVPALVHVFFHFDLVYELIHPPT